MSKFNKEFKHKGYTFNTSVELNSRAERKPNGKVWHTILTNCLGGNNYYQKDEIESYQIEEYVERHKQAAIDYIDKLTYKKQTIEEMLLTSLGFY